jgi:hypothetical protein
MGARIHKGNWLDCKVCPHNEEELAQKREKRERPSFKRKRLTAATVDLAVRRQVAYELGPDAEPTSDQKFQVLQKYGIAAPRIDRAVTKPSWMSEGTWRTKKAEFYQATKGLVARDQFKRTERNPRFFNARNPITHRVNPNSQQRNSNGYRPNSGRDQTGDRRK